MAMIFLNSTHCSLKKYRDPFYNKLTIDRLKQLHQTSLNIYYKIKL